MFNKLLRGQIPMKRVIGLVLLLVIATFSILPTSQALANTTIYRGVDANKNNGKAILSPSQFRFNPDLSTFLDPTQAPVQKQCNYGFTVTGVQFPQPGDQGQVQGLAMGYIANFDNNPAGHWGITPPDGVTEDKAKADVSAYARANRNNVVNGTLENCN